MTALGAYVALAAMLVAMAAPFVVSDWIARRRARRRWITVARIDVLRDEFWREQFERIEREQWQRERNEPRGDA